MSAHVFKMTAFAVLAVGLLSQNVKAQSLFGSGAMQGGMVCPYQQTASRAGTNISDEEREARAAVARLQAQKSANATKRDQLYKPRVDAGKRKIEQYFDADVADFLLTHIDTLKRCDQYQSLANRCATPPAGSPAPASGDAAAAAPAPTVDCAGLEPVPALLVGKWTEARGGQGNYCVGSTARSAGSVAASICSDNTLLPENPRTGRRGRGSVSSSACARALTDYRKATLDFSAAQDEEDRLVEEIATRNENINEARVTAEIERRSRVSTEAGCETCDAYSRGYSYQRPQRDWGSTLTNVIGGLGLMYVGRQAERANAEESAQLGMPSNQSYGYPYYQAGIAGVINGLAGPGAYGCASTTGGGGPIGFTANGGLNLAGGGGAFGPAGAQGGAFGYPQNMYGSPWGGGAFNPGLNINGGFNGPFGGTGGGQFGQFPGNGNMAMCFTFPCNVGGQGGAGGQFGVGGQLGIGGQFGQPQIGYDPTGQFGNQFGLNGQLSAQYQLQMLQQQQQAAQQYYQQQQQYYQQQYQAQMQYYQQVQQRQQQAAQLQQQIAQLNMQLQQIYYSNNGFGGAGSIGGSFGGSAYLGANFNLGTSYGSATIGAPLPGGYNSPTIGNPTIGNPGFNPGYNPGISNPTPGTGGTVRGR